MDSPVSDQHRHDDNASPLFLLLSKNGLPSSIGQLRRWPCPQKSKRIIVFTPHCHSQKLATRPRSTRPQKSHQQSSLQLPVTLC
jgi:hypothetical protein